MDERALEIIEGLVEEEALRDVIAEAYGGEIPAYITGFGHNHLEIKCDCLFGEETAVVTMEEAFHFGNPGFSTMLTIGGVLMDHRPAMNLAEECRAVFGYMVDHYLADKAENSEEFQEYIAMRDADEL